jgi:hypothetical protein
MQVDSFNDGVINMNIGHKRWVIADGYIPPASRELICMCHAVPPPLPKETYHAWKSAYGLEVAGWMLSN